MEFKRGFIGNKQKTSRRVFALPQRLHMAIFWQPQLLILLTGMQKVQVDGFTEFIGETTAVECTYSNGMSRG